MNTLDEELESYGRILSEKDLPIIYSLKHFSLLIDIERKRLLQIMRNRKDFYNRFLLQKKSGGYREILTPCPELKYIQRVIYNSILSKVELDEACHGFRKQHSIKTNAEVHADQQSVLKVDLYRFFDTITEERVFGMFQSLGYHSNFAVDLAKLTTLEPTYEYLEEMENDTFLPDFFKIQDTARLPQGAPTSPIISNIIAKKLDLRMRKLSEKLGVKYSRYADDLTFSGDLNRLPRITLLNDIIRNEGFHINSSKISLRKRGTKQLVTGLTVTEGVHVPKKYKQETLTHLYYCQQYGVEEHLAKIGKTGISGFREWIFGRIQFIHSIEPATGKKLLEKYDAIDWGI